MSGFQLCLAFSYVWLSASQLPVDASVMRYKGQIGKTADRQPYCPAKGHFGLLDTHIPQSDVEKVRVYPTVEILIYSADHGFNCDESSSHEPASAKLAHERALNFLRTHIGLMLRFLIRIFL
jgi:carboxymethylenebutenolidase